MRECKTSRTLIYSAGVSASVLLLFLLIVPVRTSSQLIFNDLSTLQRVVGNGWSAWSTWSSCSAACNGGVRTRRRRCLGAENLCHGRTEQTAACNLQLCDESINARDRLCKNSSLASVSDDVTLRPVIDPSRPCALVCRAPGSDEGAQASEALGTVPDGTPCAGPDLSVCLSGRCRSVGCDMVIGSQPSIDVCGVCAGNGSSCSTGSYYWSHAPRAPCMSPCQRRSAFRVAHLTCRDVFSNGEVSESYCDAASRPQNSHLLMCAHNRTCMTRWWTGEWGRCSSTCGRGLRRRIVRCVHQENNTKVIKTDDSQCDISLRPADIQSCSSRLCPRWYQSGWSQCQSTSGQTTQSNTTNSLGAAITTDASNPTQPEYSPTVCGASLAGVQRRSVFCRNADGRASQLCRPELRPDTRRDCRTHPAPCVDVRRRPSTHASTAQVPNHISSTDATLASVRSSSTTDNIDKISYEPRYEVGEWSVCSDACDMVGDVQRRTVRCRVYLHFSATSVTLPDSQCSSELKPRSRRSCQTAAPCRSSQFDLSRDSDTEFGDSELNTNDGSSPSRRHVPVGELGKDQATAPLDSRNSFVAENHNVFAKEHAEKLSRDVNQNGAIGIDQEVTQVPNYAVRLQPQHPVMTHHLKTSLTDFRTRSVDIGGSSPLVSTGLDLDEVDRISEEAGSSLSDSRAISQRNFDELSERERSFVLQLKPQSSSNSDSLRGLKKESRSSIDNMDVQDPMSPTPRQQMSRQREDEFTWKVDGFTECSASCLGGVQELIVLCVHTASTEVVNARRCARATRPHLITRTCNDRPCPARWRVAEFGTCSRTCGRGIQHRAVQCVQALARGEANILVVNDNECLHDAAPNSSATTVGQRPQESRICADTDCTPDWHPGPWSECSRACGGGLRHRWLKCQQRLADGSVMDRAPSFCPARRPSDTRPCNIAPCQAPTISTSNQTYEQKNVKRRVTLTVGGKADVFQGTTARIRCPAHRFDRAKIVWSKNNIRLSAASRVNMAHDGHLTLRMLELYDSGVYTCIAGGAKASIFINVKRNPFGEMPWVKEFKEKERRRLKLEEAQLRKKMDLQKKKAKHGRMPSGQKSYPSNTQHKYTNKKIERGKNGNEIDATETNSHVDVSSEMSLILGGDRSRSRNRWRHTATHQPRLTSTTTAPNITGNTDIPSSTFSSKSPTSTEPQRQPGTSSSVVNSSSAVLTSTLGTAEDVSTAVSRSVKADTTSTLQNVVEDIVNASMVSFNISGASYEWLMSDWSRCSQPCSQSLLNSSDEGVQVRAVQCLQHLPRDGASRVNDITRPVTSQWCKWAGLAVPANRRSCGRRRHDCPTWRLGPWRSCNRSKCIAWNTALQRRRITCHLADGSRVARRLCRKAAQSTNQWHNPSRKRECYNAACRGHWHVGSWSDCSARQCGTAGRRSRVLRCVWHGTQTAAGRACVDLPRPAVLRPCLAPACHASGSNSSHTVGECVDTADYCERVGQMSLCRLQRVRNECCHSCQRHNDNHR